MRLAGGEGLGDEGEPDAGCDQAGEPLGFGADADAQPARVGDELLPITAKRRFLDEQPARL